MSSDTKAIIGTVIATGLVVAGLLSTQIASQIGAVNTRIDDLWQELRALRALVERIHIAPEPPKHP